MINSCSQLIFLLFLTWVLFVLNGTKEILCALLQANSLLISFTKQQLKSRGLPFGQFSDC
uniref:Uncharacterized protein n=1 Tax=Bird gammacoronavirus AnasCN24 TaxID=3237959 RepID=A0AB39ACR2_9GAMC